MAETALYWNVGTWNSSVWGPFSPSTEQPYVTQVCAAYTPTYPPAPVPQTPRYLNIIEPGPVLYFKPGIYWERCVEAYFPGGGFLTPGGAAVSGYDSTEGTTTVTPTTTQNFTITLIGA